MTTYALSASSGGGYPDVSKQGLTFGEVVEHARRWAPEDSVTRVLDGDRIEGDIRARLDLHGKAEYVNVTADLADDFFTVQEEA